MYQSITGSNSRTIAGQKADAQTSHLIDINCLAILVTIAIIQVIGLFSCLIRSDYNFAIIFFCYFIWQQRKDTLALKIILGATVLIVIFDIIFALTQIRVWLTEDTGNDIWQAIRPMHNFGVFCFALIMILKIILIVLTVRGIKIIDKAVHPV